MAELAGFQDLARHRGNEGYLAKHSRDIPLMPPEWSLTPSVRDGWITETFAAWAERAAIREIDGGQSRAAAERAALAEISGRLGACVDVLRLAWLCHSDVLRLRPYCAPSGELTKDAAAALAGWSQSRLSGALEMLTAAPARQQNAAAPEGYRPPGKVVAAKELHRKAHEVLGRVRHGLEDNGSFWIASYADAEGRPTWSVLYRVLDQECAVPMADHYRVPCSVGQFRRLFGVARHREPDRLMEVVDLHERISTPGTHMQIVDDLCRVDLGRTLGAQCHSARIHALS